MTGGKRRAVLAGGLGVLLAAGLVLVVGVVAVVVFLGGSADEAPSATSTGDCGGAAPAVPVLDPGPRVGKLTAEQTGNARIIVQVAARLSASQGLSADRTRQAAVIGIMTAMQESTLRNVHYGDRDSLGLFQQRAAWASAAERTTPSIAATMFYTGGHGGQRGLFDIRGWPSMPLWAAAQAVQVSAFPTAYARWESLARATVAALLGGVVPVAAVSPAPTAGLDLGPAACQDPPPAQGGREHQGLGAAAAGGELPADVAVRLPGPPDPARVEAAHGSGPGGAYGHAGVRGRGGPGDGRRAPRNGGQSGDPRPLGRRAVRLRPPLRHQRPHRGTGACRPRAAGSVAVSPQDADGAWLIALEGEHGLSTAALLEQATIGLWQRCTVAVVDLSAAAFIDTTVINWLMNAKHKLEASSGGTLGIVEGPPASFAARLFGQLSLRDVLACYPTRQDALAQTRAPTALGPWAEP